jgi:hypothetical protein
VIFFFLKRLPASYIDTAKKSRKRVYLEGGGKGGRGLFQFAERLAALTHSGQLIHRQQLITENRK